MLANTLLVPASLSQLHSVGGELITDLSDMSGQVQSQCVVLLERAIQELDTAIQEHTLQLPDFI